MTRLRRSDLTRPGITRAVLDAAAKPPTYTFTGPDGAPVDPATQARCEALVLPPAWQDVWISPYANGHIQAVGTDAAGRRQYRYHEQWTSQRARANFARVLDAARVLPEVREKSWKALQGKGLPRERVLACAVRLLELGFFRVGSEIYAESNGTFGLATIRRDHVTLDDDGRGVTFDYRAKSGKQRHRAVPDPAARACVEELLARDDPNPELLAWWDDSHGRWVDVRSDDINDYLRELSGCDLTAKDFRTWSATVLCAVGLAVSINAGDSPTARKRAVARAIAETADYLGNTPAVCRRSYVHPQVLDLFNDGVTVADELDELGDVAAVGDLATQGRLEAAVLEMLTDPLAARRRTTRRRGRVRRPSAARTQLASAA